MGLMEDAATLRQLLFTRVRGETHRDLSGIKGIEKLIDVPVIKQDLGGQEPGK